MLLEHSLGITVYCILRLILLQLLEKSLRFAKLCNKFLFDSICSRLFFDTWENYDIFCIFGSMSFVQREGTLY